MSPAQPMPPPVDVITWKYGKAELGQLRLVVTPRKGRHLVLNHLWMVTRAGKSLLDPTIHEQVILDSGFAKSKRAGQKAADIAARQLLKAIK